MDRRHAARVCQFCFRTYLPTDCRQRYCQPDCSHRPESITRRRKALEMVVDEWPHGYTVTLPTRKATAKLLMQER